MRSRTLSVFLLTSLACIWNTTFDCWLTFALGTKSFGGVSVPQRNWPSVSVQMVTYERPELLLEALSQVARQEYPGTLEAVVIDDSASSLKDRLARLQETGALLPEIHYIYLPERASIGVKRNMATRNTNADVLCVWDDDDVFTVDRVRKQVEHLLGDAKDIREPSGVACSGIEVVSLYSVPTSSLHLRGPRLPQLVFENTFCCSRAWWESNGCVFGEPWEVSGQGEGTLEPWWNQVSPLTGAEEPFLYIYLPSSASGGTALNLDPPVPTKAMFALVQALRNGRFPDDLPGAHVQGVLKGTREGLAQLLNETPVLFQKGSTPDLPAFVDFNAFQAQYK